jgi:N-acyl-L-homoserine lactone synthetase
MYRVEMAKQRHEAAKSEGPFPPHFDFSVINNARLRDSYALRYEVYCHERHFLDPEDYPSKFEMDSYDNHAIHVGGVDREGVLVGTVRLVLPSARGFPLFEHCELFPEYQYLADPGKLAQLSAAACQDHRHRPEIILGLYKALYQASKREGITHWFAAMEKPLLRLLRRYNFDFKPIGPELDYYGPVIPYFAKISEIEAGVHRHCPDMLAEFVRGLEPELVPAFARE